MSPISWSEPPSCCAQCFIALWCWARSCTMGVNLMVMSLTTPVHLLTPQSVNGFGAHRGSFSHLQCINTPHYPDFTANNRQQQWHPENTGFCLANGLPRRMAKAYHSLIFTLLEVKSFAGARGFDGGVAFFVWNLCWGIFLFKGNSGTVFYKAQCLTLLAFGGWKC